MNKINFIPYSYIEENLKRREKIIKLIFVVMIILLFISLGILKNNINRLNNLKEKEKRLVNKVEGIYLSKIDNKKIINEHLEDLCEMINNNDTFQCITIKDNSLWVGVTDVNINGCKKTIMDFEKSGFRIISLKGPEERKGIYYYEVGAIIDEN